MSLDKRHLWSSEEIEAFERWEMPDLTGVSLRSLGRGKISDGIVDGEAAAEEVEEEIQLPTLEEVEAIRKAAYDEAYAEGMEQGRLDGFEQGREDGFLKGKAEGHEEGVQKGHAEGLQQGEREVNDALSRLNSILALLHEPIAVQHDELEKVLYDLLVHLVTLMTRQELSIDSSVVTQIIQESLAALPRNSDRIRVFINSADFDLAREQASRQIDPWQVFVDDSISAGGCRVETLSSLVDNSVESRLQDTQQQVVAGRYTKALQAEPDTVVPDKPQAKASVQKPVANTPKTAAKPQAAKAEAQPRKPSASPAASEPGEPPLDS